MSGLRVASWNIHKGVGTDRKRDLARTATVIAEISPDIMALQEADTRFGTRRGLMDLESLAREHGLKAIKLPGAGPAHGWHGNVLLLRSGTVESVHRVTLPGMEPRGALIADLRFEDHPLRVIATHLGLAPWSRAAQARHLLGLLAEMDARTTLFMGDLNEWRIGGSVAMQLLSSVFTSAIALPSFPARYPVFALDRMMVTGPARLSQGTVHQTGLARRASDHLPISAHLDLGLQG